MDALIGNLKTPEMNRSQDLSKKEAKKNKSLVLKFTLGEESSEENDMTYLTKEIFRRSEGLEMEGTLLELQRLVTPVTNVEWLGIL